MAVLLTLRADCSLLALKPAHPSRFLPVLSSRFHKNLYGIRASVGIHNFGKKAEDLLKAG